ncbi:arginine repressor [candidate division WOR-3 bacterium]|nr:arginine repressor [candidate division WOR-3 bacterium]
MKRERQNKIIEIVREKSVRTQGELIKYLRGVGEKVAQSTLSRDIRETGIIKVPTGIGSYIYELAEGVHFGDLSSFSFEFSHFVTGINRSQNLIIVHTTAGNAQGVARSIDILNLDKIMGVVAGDDTIFVAIDKVSNIPTVENYFKQAMKGLLKRKKILNINKSRTRLSRRRKQ